MKIHQVQRNTALKTARLVGRGGKRGKTSGRGTKGQKARAGRKLYPEIRDIIKKIPKLRGRGKNSNTSRHIKPMVVSLTRIDALFSAGDIVSPQSLVEKKLVKKINGQLPPVKIVGGELKKKVTFVGVAMSDSVKKSLGITTVETKVTTSKTGEQKTDAPAKPAAKKSGKKSAK